MKKIHGYHDEQAKETRSFRRYVTEQAPNEIKDDKRAHEGLRRRRELERDEPIREAQRARQAEREERER